MTKMPGEYKYKKKILASVSCFSFFGLVYLGIVGMTIRNISEYQSSEKQISALTAEISKMEFAYLAKQAEISPSYAVEHGFVEPENIVIARMPSSSVALENHKK